MADLSPQAQAVLDAFGTYPLRADHIGEDLIPALTAALRAAADQVVPKEQAPKLMKGVDLERLAQRQHSRAQIFAIAAELEALDD